MLGVAAFIGLCFDVEHHLGHCIDFIHFGVKESACALILYFRTFCVEEQLLLLLLLLYAAKLGAFYRVQLHGVCMRVEVKWKGRAVIYCNGSLPLNAPPQRSRCI